MNYLDHTLIFVGKLFLISLISFIIVVIWYQLYNWVWNVHSNLLLTRHYCFKVKGKEFIKWIRNREKTKHDSD